MTHTKITAKEAKTKLIEGNEKYVISGKNDADISAAARLKTSREGQFPYAIIIGCSDSRVIPEVIFNAGIGELFTVRVAGNVIDEALLGSVEYAAGHLGCPLAVVLGHEKCGAVAAALEGGAHGNISAITREILAAAGSETDPDTVCRSNVSRSVAKIKSSSAIKDLLLDGFEVVGAVYHLESGRVEFI